MIYIYRRSSSDSARLLADGLQVNSRRVRDLAGVHYGQGLRANDAVVCWGESLVDVPAGVKILNGTPIQNKYTDAVDLKAAGVPTVEVARERPNQPAPPLFSMDRYRGLGELDRARAEGLRVELQRFLAQPAVQPIMWLPRRNNHIGGRDLLNVPATADYWAKKEPLVKEYRIHCFLGKSIRAGVKAPREGAQAHPWIRSYDGGWGIQYNNFKSKKAMRELAAKTCEALGLDFAAIDIGEKADGTLIVLEANRAPGLEGGTVTAYSEAIRGWINNEVQ